MKHSKVLIVAVLALFVVMTAVGAYAYFSDTETAADNSFAAGTLDLKTGNTDGVSQSYTVTNLKPTDWALAGQINLKNDGTIPGNLWLEIKNVKNLENNCIEPEQEAGDATCDEFGGELGNFIRPSFQMNADPWTRYGGSLTLNASEGIRVDIKTLQPGEVLPMTLWATWHDSSPLDNLAQGDGATFDVVFHLDQN